MCHFEEAMPKNESYLNKSCLGKCCAQHASQILSLTARSSEQAFFGTKISQNKHGLE
jgi:hypothetical protein